MNDGAEPDGAEPAAPTAPTDSSSSSSSVGGKNKVADEEAAATRAACEKCRSRKVKCDGRRPCGNCTARYLKKHRLKSIEDVDVSLLECVYNPASRRGPPAGRKAYLLQAGKNSVMRVEAQQAQVANAAQAQAMGVHFGDGVLGGMGGCDALPVSPQMWLHQQHQRQVVQMGGGAGGAGSASASTSAVTARDPAWIAVGPAVQNVVEGLSASEMKIIIRNLAQVSPHLIGTYIAPIRPESPASLKRRQSRASSARYRRKKRQVKAAKEDDVTASTTVVSLEKKRQEKASKDGGANIAAVPAAGTPIQNAQAFFTPQQMLQNYQRQQMMTMQYSMYTPSWPPFHGVHPHISVGACQPPPSQQRQSPAQQRTAPPSAKTQVPAHSPSKPRVSTKPVTRPIATTSGLDAVVKAQLSDAMRLDFDVRPRPSRSGDGTHIPVYEDEDGVTRNPGDRVRYRVLLILKEWEYDQKLVREREELAEGAVRIACYDDGHTKPRGKFCVDRWFKQFRESLKGCPFRTQRRDLGMRRGRIKGRKSGHFKDVDNDKEEEEETPVKESTHNKDREGSGGDKEENLADGSDENKDSDNNEAGKQEGIEHA